MREIVTIHMGKDRIRNVIALKMQKALLYTVNLAPLNLLESSEA
jgi:hypothetical protein